MLKVENNNLFYPRMATKLLRLVNDRKKHDLEIGKSMLHLQPLPHCLSSTIKKRIKGQISTLWQEGMV